MEWYKLGENPEFITEMYTDIPSLEHAELNEMMLYLNEAKVILRANLSRYVDKPPVQWSKKGYNTTIIQLDFLGVEDIEITRWSIFSFVNINIELTENRKLRMSILSSEFQIQIVARSFRIGNISAYQQRP